MKKPEAFDVIVVGAGASGIEAGVVLNCLGFLTAPLYLFSQLQVLLELRELYERRG